MTVSPNSSRISLLSDRGVARRYAWALEESFERIRQMPEIGVLRRYGPRLRDVRMWPVPEFSRFFVFYRVTSTTVEVIRVLHSARDVRRVLKQRRR